jgi:hypothetical protein
MDAKLVSSLLCFFSECLQSIHINSKFIFRPVSDIKVGLQEVLRSANVLLKHFFNDSLYLSELHMSPSSLRLSLVSW